MGMLSKPKMPAAPALPPPPPTAAASGPSAMKRPNGLSAAAMGGTFLTGGQKLGTGGASGFKSLLGG